MSLWSILGTVARPHLPSRPYRQQAVPAGESGQRACARGDWCSAKTRDEEGNWLPALTYQAFCPADTSAITRCAAEIPPFWLRLASWAVDPMRRAGRPVRSVPGSRVPVCGPADALLREIAPVVGGWASRVRSVPGLDLTAPGHAPGTPERVRDDCKVLAVHAGPLLALQDGWTTRLYDLPPGDIRIVPQKKWGTFTAARGICRYCGRAVSRSPVSGWWWAMDGLAGPDCAHDAAAGEPEKHGPVPADLEDEIGGEEIVLIGDGWVKVMSQRDGTDAGLEILDLHYQARRLLGETPARPERLEGVPCKECEEMALERAEPPSDPELEAPHSRCALCRHTMTREEYDQWAAMYRSWAEAVPGLSCRVCQKGQHEDCRWQGCACRADGHAGSQAAA